MMLRIPLCIGFLLVAGISTEVNSMHMWNAENQTKTFGSPFRYVIVHNEVVADGGASPKHAYRYVEILLDEKAFSEETLKALFKLVSKQFAKPKDMDVYVWTNLEQVRTPEEREAGAMSDAPDNPALDRYPNALLIRKGGNELFRYTPSAPNTSMKTVVLKGRDPQSQRK